MRYRVDNGNLKKLSNIIVNPSSGDINNFEDGTVWCEYNEAYLYTYLKINNNNISINACSLLPPYLEFASDSAFTLSVDTPGWDGTLEYSTDTSTWTTWDGSQLSGTSSQPIYLRGRNNTVISDGETWTFTGKYITGNIENLLDYQTVANGGHPVMGNYCYSNMFNGCTSLVNTPSLPATTLATSCYISMFQGCTSLTTPPELPATTLATSCYNSMFQGCESLTTAPELPATTLATSCYGSMFRGCTSLVNAPELPATTLAEYCYQYMFFGCTSLTTSLELPATTLAHSCYYCMFFGCISLTTASELPATTLTYSCYEGMFYDCTSLKLSTTQDPDVYKYTYRIPTSGEGTTTTGALSDMFTNTGGTFTGTPEIDTTYFTDHQPI